MTDPAPHPPRQAVKRAPITKSAAASPPRDISHGPTAKHALSPHEEAAATEWVDKQNTAS